MLLDRPYPAKILLFGEYTILNGSMALATAYSEFSGKWSFASHDTDAARSSHEILKGFSLNHPTSDLSLDLMKRDLSEGLWFDSNIPHGFGLGSSGALIAAIYEAYSARKGSLLEDKDSLARLEDYFHGSSSGIDPLVSLINKNLLIHDFNNVSLLENDLNLSGFFLLNTGKPRNTGPLVSIYQEKMKDPEFKRGCAEILSREVNFAIKALIDDDRSNLFHHLWLISKFQLEYFSEMIPGQMRGLWSQGLESGSYVLKLCGAGGGGFILGYSDKLSQSSLGEIFSQNEFRELAAP
jgi:mevalonate kinase